MNCPYVPIAGERSSAKWIASEISDILYDESVAITGPSLSL